MRPTSIPLLFVLSVVCALLTTRATACEPQNSTQTTREPVKTMTETFTLSRRLEPVASGGLLATVELEITQTTDPLEFIFTVKNENSGLIVFPIDVGNISLGFTNAVNIPIPTPSMDRPMDLPRDAPDPNQKRIEFYAIEKDGKRGSRFLEHTFSLKPGESAKILVRMGPEVMNPINAILPMGDRDATEFKMGVKALISIRPADDREFFGRFRTEKTMFFPYQIPKETKEDK